MRRDATSQHTARATVAYTLAQQRAAYTRTSCFFCQRPPPPASIHSLFFLLPYPTKTTNYGGVGSRAAGVRRGAEQQAGHGTPEALFRSARSRPRTSGTRGETRRRRALLCTEHQRKRNYNNNKKKHGSKLILPSKEKHGIVAEESSRFQTRTTGRVPRRWEGKGSHRVAQPRKRTKLWNRHIPHANAAAPQSFVRVRATGTWALTRLVHIH